MHSVILVRKIELISPSFYKSFLFFLAFIFVFDYHPCSSTLYSTYFDLHLNQTNLIQESTLWSYAIQIASAVKTIHASGIAARNIDPHTILVTSSAGNHHHRVKLNGASISDVLQFDGVNHFARYQVTQGNVLFKREERLIYIHFLATGSF
jgi:serine/threonine protein kinase